MVCCAVDGCTNHDRRQKELGFWFHQFPKEKEMRLKWIHACRRADSFRADVSRVCSQHFSELDYVRDLKGELLGLPIKRVLKPDAVPNIFLPNRTSDCISDRTRRAEKRHLKEYAKQIVESAQSSTDETELSALAAVEEMETTLTGTSGNGTDIFYSFEDEMPTQPSDVVFLTAEIDRLKQQVKHLQDQLTAANDKMSEMKHYSSVFEGRFSENQQQAMLQGRCTKWLGDDIAKAVTLQSISPKALDYVRNVMNVAIPSESTIKRRLRQFKVSPGVIELSLSILKAQSSVLNDFERNVILSFDEMKIDSSICYDASNDIIRGPHNNVQVMMVRSVIGKWMQPIYYNFDTPVKKELLYDVIEVVEKSGFKVRGFVCDMGPSNRKLMSDLNVSWETPFTKNPTDEMRKLWVFCDVPHALKLLRNHLLDDGYELNCGNHVDATAFGRLIEMQSNGGDLKYAHKINMQHILVAGTERQNVRKAAELLSSTVGNAIIHNFPEFKHVGETVITIINNGFDVLNSRVPYISTNCLKSAYGNSLEEQNNALDKFSELIHTMRAMGKKGCKRSSLLPFQQGLLMSINSLRGLFEDLKNEGFTYIMASRCNQDVLESYFSKIRGLGKFYDHPLPTVVSHRIKSFLMGRNAHVVINSKNCQIDRDCSSLSSQLLSQNESINSENSTVHDVKIYEDVDGDFGFNIDYLIAQVDDDFEDEDFGFDVDTLLAQADDYENEVNTVEEKLEVVEMVAGYLAFRMKKKYPEKAHLYGDLSRHVTKSGKNWLQTLSRGSLTRPTDEWMKQVLQMERQFSEFHGLQFNKCPNVFTTLTGIIKATHPEIDPFLTNCFVRTRTFFRIKCINVRNREKKLKKRREGRCLRDLSNTSENRKTSKKIKKVVA